MEKITLPYKFDPRTYQQPLLNAMLDDEVKRGIGVIPRRNGKDLTMWNGMICNAFKRVGLYYYLAPYYNQVRQIIWEGFTKEGRRFLDYIPPQLIKSMTKLDMRIDLVNGSQIKLQGSDQIDRIVGTNPCFVVFTEFSLHKPGAWEYLRPVLAENDGQAWFNGTPRGMNHFYDLYRQAQLNTNWFVDYYTRDDTGVPTLEAIEEDRKSGMPEALIKQEYYCSFTSGSVGAYYSLYMDKAREDNRLTRVPFDPRLPVYTAWDIGVNDTTAIWFIQLHRNEIRIIDYYETNGEGLPHYVKVLREKPYVYEEHIGPHDLAVREFTTGTSRLETAADLGLDFTIAPKLSIQEGIDAVRNIMPRCWFDVNNADKGIQALTHYRKKKDEKSNTFMRVPLHDWASNGADAFRMFAIVIDNLMDMDHYRPPNVIRTINNKRRRVAA